jgi:peptidoglycan/LPS O-acetylase OafA/YrhL
MTGAFDAFKDRRYFGSLDGLRCLSVLAVIWHHTASSAFPGSRLAAAGPQGVTLFFAISGFLITTLLLRERERTGAVNLKPFYIRRTLRIFPLYYAVLAAYVILVLATESDEGRRSEFFANLPYFLTYTSNFAVSLSAAGTIFYFAWSLAAEEQFYAAWPWAEKCLVRPALLMLLLLGGAALARFEVAPLPHLLRVALFSIMPALCFGVLTAHLLHRRRSFDIVHRLAGWKLASPVALVTALIILSLPGVPLLPDFILSFLVLTCVLREDNGLALVLRWKPVQWIGFVSYGMYLMHMLAYNAAKKGLSALDWSHPLAPFLATTILVTLMASLSYRYYESWFLRLKPSASRPRGEDGRSPEVMEVCERWREPAPKKGTGS